MLKILHTERNITLSVAGELSSYSLMLEQMLAVVAELFNLRDINVSLIFFKEKNTQMAASTWSNSSKEFIIYFNVNNLSTLRFTELWLHEFKHIEQYSTKKLVKSELGHYWYGDFYSESFCQDSSNYETLPWEIESFRAESSSPLLSSIVKSPLLTSIKKLVSLDTLLTA